MAKLTKQEITDSSNSSFPDNNQRLITPLKFRSFFLNVFDSFVNWKDGVSELINGNSTHDQVATAKAVYNLVLSMSNSPIPVATGLIRWEQIPTVDQSNPARLVYEIGYASRETSYQPGQVAFGPGEIIYADHPDFALINPENERFDAIVADCSVPTGPGVTLPLTHIVGVEAPDNATTPVIPAEHLVLFYFRVSNDGVSNIDPSTIVSNAALTSAAVSETTVAPSRAVLWGFIGQSSLHSFFTGSTLSGWLNQLRTSIAALAATGVSFTPSDNNNVTGFWATLLSSGSTTVKIALDWLAEKAIAKAEKIIGTTTLTGTTYTLAVTDQSKRIRINTTSANTVTLPPTSGFTLNEPVMVCIVNTGVTTFVAGSGVTITNDRLKSWRKGSWITAIPSATNVWDLGGDTVL